MLNPHFADNPWNESCIKLDLNLIGRGQGGKKLISEEWFLAGPSLFEDLPGIYRRPIVVAARYTPEELDLMP